MSSPGELPSEPSAELPPPIPMSLKHSSKTDDHMVSSIVALGEEFKKRDDGGHIMLVIDASLSMGGYNPQRSGSTKYPRRAMANTFTMLKANCPTMLMEVIFFNHRDRITVMRPMQVVADCKEITKDEYKLNSHTHFYDAIAHVYDQINSNDFLSKGPVAVMFLTDGEDTGSTTTQQIARKHVDDLVDCGVYITVIAPTWLRQNIADSIGVVGDKFVGFDVSKPASISTSMSSGSQGMVSHMSSGGMSSTLGSNT